MEGVRVWNSEQQLLSLTSPKLKNGELPFSFNSIVQNIEKQKPLTTLSSNLPVAVCLYYMILLKIFANILHHHVSRVILHGHCCDNDLPSSSGLLCCSTNF